jgi:hypothetical protein
VHPLSENGLPVPPDTVTVVRDEHPEAKKEKFVTKAVFQLETSRVVREEQLKTKNEKFVAALVSHPDTSSAVREGQLKAKL